MSHKIETIEDGSVTSPKGFQAVGVAAGIKGEEKLDLGLLVSKVRAATVGVLHA